MKTQQQINQQQYHNKAQNYLDSQNHAQGIEFEKIKQKIEQLGRPVKILDLGCGAGHVSYQVAQICEQVIA